MKEKIFFNPPIRESGQVKAMFKGINRGVTA
jgi:dihydroorotase-like cyclic amidohydrolase